MSLEVEFSIHLNPVCLEVKAELLEYEYIFASLKSFESET